MLLQSFCRYSGIRQEMLRFAQHDNTFARFAPFSMTFQRSGESHRKSLTSQIAQFLLHTFQVALHLAFQPGLRILV